MGSAVAMLDFLWTPLRTARERHAVLEFDEADALFAHRVSVVHPGSLADIERHIVVVGSHDLCLNLIDDLLHKQHKAFNLSSSHVGSLAGIMAIKQGRCHIAGSHLLDPSDG